MAQQMGAGHTDSVEKIIQRYFSAVTLEPFEYQGLSYQPKNLRVSPGIFIRRMTCVANCGGCCRRFTNDWLISEVSKIEETHRKWVAPREIDFNGKKVEVWSDTQQDHSDYFCRNLRKADGRCGIHGFHPFSCDFELLRFHHFKDDNHAEGLDHRPFGRGWHMKRIDGERGALCEWREQGCDPEWIADLVRKLNRLEDWCVHFGVKSTVSRIVDWLQRGPHTRPLIVGPSQDIGGFEIELN